VALSSPVGWDDDPRVARWQPLPMLTADVRADVCVVGLGGSGLAAVDEVLRRGLSVVGIDAGRVGAGAAGRNGGFLLGGPASGLPRAIEAWGLDAALELYRHTLDELDGLAELLGPEVIRRTGSIRLAGLPGQPVDEAESADRIAELADCERQAEVLRANGFRVERYDGPLGEGLWLPDDAAMNPARRAVGLAELYRGRARLFERSAASAVGTGLVRTPTGSVSAGLAIVAVDGGLERLFPELIGRVRTARLQMASTDPVRPHRLPCPVYGRWGFDYAQQDPSGRLFVGGGRDRFAEDEWTFDAEPSRPVQDWIEGVATRFAGARVRIRHRWAASVGFTADARALVTEVRPGVIACGGYNGTGNLVGPVAARSAVAWGLDSTPPGAAFAR
jgi:glycine/D-amino acid oxidase-like deaminating enzyme